MDLKEKILTGSMDLFTKYGIKSVTMDFIAEELGVSKRTIYELFKDKNNLLEEGILRGNEIHAKRLEAILSETSNALEGLYLIGKANQQMMSTVNPSFINDMIKHYPKIAEKMNILFIEGSRTLMEQLLAKGTADGLFYSMFDVNKLGFVWQKIIEMVSNDIHQNNSDSQKELWQNHLFIPFLRGICTEKGRSQIDKYLEKESVKS